MLKSSLYKSILFLLITINTSCQKIESNKQNMDTIFYHNDLNNPLELKIQPVKIQSAGSFEQLKDYTPSKNQKNYLTRYLNNERNSRLNSTLPTGDLWEVKWRSEINPSAYPWFLLLKDDRIIIQNESGWQLFDLSGKFIGEGVKAEGDILINNIEPDFYVNDPSGFMEAFDLNSGKSKFLFYPYFGKGFNRSIIFSDGSKIINLAAELPVMTHNSPIKNPELTILETINLGNSKVIDQDGVLNSAAQLNNLLCKAGGVIYVIHHSTIILAVPNHIYFLDSNLEITKEFTENFVPLEMSIDEEMRIYLLAEINAEEKQKNVLWVIDSTGNMLINTEIEPLKNNFLSPPAIGFEHTAYIRDENKIIAVDTTGNVLWKEFTQKPLAGITVTKDYLLTAEGNLLSAFDSRGGRKFIYQFEDELSTSALIVENQIFVATHKHLYCLIPKK